MKNEMNEIPTPETDALYNPENGWTGVVPIDHARELGRRLTVAREALLLALHVRGTPDDNEEVRSRMEQALTLTEPKP